jgi:hypothetical protein
MTARLHPVPAEDLAELRRQSDVPEAFYDDPALDLDQSWDVLSRVLTAAGAWAGQSILGGEPFGEDQGYGPPRTLTAGQVAAVAGELAAIGDERFRSLFAGADFADCYGANNYTGEEALVVFRWLRDCYAAAAARGQAMTLFM